jgi:hypothetical protein
MTIFSDQTDSTTAKSSDEPAPAITADPVEQVAGDPALQETNAIKLHSSV